MNKFFKNYNDFKKERDAKKAVEANEQTVNEGAQQIGDNYLVTVPIKASVVKQYVSKVEKATGKDIFAMMAGAEVADALVRASINKLKADQVPDDVLFGGSDKWNVYGNGEEMVATDLVATGEQPAAVDGGVEQPADIAPEAPADGFADPMMGAEGEAPVMTDQPVDTTALGGEAAPAQDGDVAQVNGEDDTQLHPLTPVEEVPAEGTEGGEGEGEAAPAQEPNDDNLEGGEGEGQPEEEQEEEGEEVTI